VGVVSNSLPLWGGHLEGYRHPHLPTVEALDTLWQEVSSKPLYAPRTLSKYLKLRYKMSLRQVDAKQVEVIAPLGKVNDCSSCTDICCVGPHSTVSLRLQDIAALIDLGRDDLITMEKPDFPEHTRAKRSALRKTLASTGWRTFPVLKKDSMGACAALGRDGQCGLFPHWPLSCARFPYSLHSNCREVFYSQRCDAFWIRQDAREVVSEMVVKAVDAYNARIRDAVLLSYAPQRLDELGLLKYLVQAKPSDEAFI
jgi:Fe-S-cluster containining protein